MSFRFSLAFSIVFLVQTTYFVSLHCSCILLFEPFFAYLRIAFHSLHKNHKFIMHGILVVSFFSFKTLYVLFHCDWFSVAKKQEAILIFFIYYVVSIRIL